MSGFLGLHTALTGIRAGQRGLDTASHNVANANTPGYTRQRTVQQSRFPWHSESGPIGTGVDVVRVERLRDAFLDTRVRSTGMSFAAADTTAALLQRAEDVLGEPDHGISPLLGEVFDAFEDLALTPADGAARQQVVASLDALVARFASVASGWDQLAADTSQRVDLAVADLNTRLGRISELNRTLGGFGSGQRPNDLLDERDALIDDLAQMVGATATTTATGMVEVALDGVVLVSAGPPSTAQQLGYVGGVSVTGPPAVAVTARGELGALHEFVSATLPAVQGDLDALASDVAAALNAQHQAGVVQPGGAPGGPLLSGTTATTLARAPGLTTQTLAAATPGGALHDGRNAQALADLREGPLDDAVRRVAIGLGQRVATATAIADAQESLFVGATIARQSGHSVSIDEEMVSLVQHQRALEASARVMTAVDEALDVLVNRTGVVGR